MTEALRWHPKPLPSRFILSTPSIVSFGNALIFSSNSVEVGMRMQLSLLPQQATLISQSPAVGFADRGIIGSKRGGERAITLASDNSKIPHPPLVMPSDRSEPVVSNRDAPSLHPREVGGFGIPSWK